MPNARVVANGGTRSTDLCGTPSPDDRAGRTLRSAGRAARARRFTRFSLEIRLPSILARGSCRTPRCSRTSRGSCGLLHRAARSRRREAAGRLRHVGTPRLFARGSFNESHILAITQAICHYRARARHRRPALPRHRHARAVRAGLGQRARGARGQRRRRDDRRRRRLHADAGHFARDPRLQPRPHIRPRRRHRHHALAQPAGGRRLQVQPAARRARRHRCRPAWIEAAANALLADGARATCKRIPHARALRGAHHAPPRLPARYVADLGERRSTWTRSAARRCASASIRSAAPACTTGRAIAERLSPRPRRRQRRRSIRRSAS